MCVHDRLSPSQLETLNTVCVSARIWQAAFYSTLSCVCAQQASSSSSQQQQQAGVPGGDRFNGDTAAKGSAAGGAAKQQLLQSVHGQLLPSTLVWAEMVRAMADAPLYVILDCRWVAASRSYVGR